LFTDTYSTGALYDHSLGGVSSRLCLSVLFSLYICVCLSVWMMQVQCSSWWMGWFVMEESCWVTPCVSSTRYDSSYNAV